MATEERTEQASPRRRREAREKGQVANSVDLTRAVGLLAIYLVWKTAGGFVCERGLTMMRTGLDLNVPTELGPEQALAVGVRLMPMAAAMVAPVMIAAILGAALGTFTQTKLLVSTKLLNPDWNRINPLNGAKRLVSWRGVVSAIKGTVKVALVLAMAAWVLRARADEIVTMSAMGLAQTGAVMVSIAMEIGIKCAALGMVLGAADYAWEWWEQEKSLRMTKQDVKRELRDQDGDPQVRGRRRQLRRGMLEQGISGEMPQASVVVTNPTHYAVALRYESGTMDAPKVVAKGQRAIARRIVEMARTWNIPVVQEPPVARALFSMASVGQFVPEELYQTVAEILAAVYQRKRERLRRGRLAGGGMT